MRRRSIICCLPGVQSDRSASISPSLLLLYPRKKDSILMSTTTTRTFSRNTLNEEASLQTAQQLQKRLVDLIDLGLLLKQAHWNVIGMNFRSVHLQLDEVIDSVRAASDEFAERISTLGIAADGRSLTVSQDTELEQYPSGFVRTEQTVRHVADALSKVIEGLRSSLRTLGDVDPISEDLCISTCAALEKHLWMVQAQEA